MTFKEFKINFIYTILIVIVAISCGGRNDKEIGVVKSKSEQADIPSPQEMEKSTQPIDIPKFSNTSTSQELKNGIENLTNEIDKSLEGIKPLKKKLTIFNKPNTPVKIWFSEKNLKPIKIVQREANDSGVFTGLSRYYFVNGELWYSDQPFAKYIFESGNLKFWMDENWNINQIPEENLKNREDFLNQHIAHILNN